MKVYDRNNIQKGLEQLYAYNIYEKPTTFVEYQPKQIQNQNFLKPIAFYLPQYYATKINDKNWGAGFTEWTNVAKAVPQYLGHYQPHIPERLGYYDLRYVDIMERQSHLAAEYGLFGFCFYYYYFQGKTQLELPLLNYAYNQNIKFPFCLCWANENWTRKWDGKKQYILLEQKYEKKDMLDFISKISNYFFCENYIRVNNRPLLIIYNAMEIPDLDYYIKLWRDYCIKIGIGDIYLVCAKTFGIKVEKIINIFDAFVEFPPHDIHTEKKVDYSLLLNKNFKGTIYNIKDYIEHIETKYKYPLFKCAFPSWDNSPRVGSNAKIFSDASPETFEIWLKKIIDFTIKEHDIENRFFFINAWNEWGEGAHLEPDRKYGYSYLNILRNCIEEKSNEKYINYHSLS